MHHNLKTQMPKDLSRLSVWHHLLLFIALSFQSLPAVSASKESELKVAFLYNFAKYTKWPNDIGKNFNLCFLGEDLFGDALNTIKDKRPHGKTLIFKKGSSVDEAAVNCQMIFIGSTQVQEVKKVVKKLAGRPLLTVVEMPDFKETGAMLNLIRKGTKQKFEVSQKAAEESGLSFSSKLLKIGILVD